MNSQTINLSELTVCILTLNRPTHIRRQIAYYASINVSVVILDASDESQPTKMPANIKYHHIPRSSYIYRLNYLTQIVATKFLVLQADDDFHGIQGLAECVSFLKSNSDFSCAQGRYLRFFSKDTSNWGTDYEFQNSLLIKSSSTEQRVKEIFDSGMHFVYAVMSTQVFLETVRIVKDLEIGNLSVNELVFNFTLGCFGSYKTIPVFYSVRGMDLRPAGIESSTFEFWKSSENAVDFKNFEKSITELYMQKLKCDRGHAESIVRQLMANYDSRVTQNNPKHKSVTLTSLTKHERARDRVRNYLKRKTWLYSMSKYRKRSVWLFFWNLSCNSNFVKFTSDFSRIKSFIES